MQLRKRGIALIATLILATIVSAVMLIIFNSTVSEIRHSQDNASITSSVMLARGVASMSDRFMKQKVRNKLEDIIHDEADTASAWPFGTGPVGGDPTPESVAQDLQPVSTLLQAEIDAELCGNTLSPIDLDASLSISVFVTDQSCGQTLPGGIKLSAGKHVQDPSSPQRTYAIPYVIVAEATENDYRRNIVIQGEYQFALGGGKFSEYAVFTSNSITSGGGEVWFNSNTLIEGPIHTNQYFRFDREPWFGGFVSSAGYDDPSAGPNSARNRRGAIFGTQGFVEEGNIASNPSYIHPSNPSIVDEPDFTSGADFSAQFIDLPTNAFDQQMIANQNGLVLSGNLHSLNLWAGDASGNTVTSGAASFQYIESCTSATACTRYRYDDAGRLYQSNSGSWTLLDANFNGIVYAEGEIERLQGPDRTTSDVDSAPPAIAAFSKLSIIAEDQIRITGDIKYEDPPCTGYPTRDSNGNVTSATCNNLTAQNVLGIFTPNGDVLVGNFNADATLNAPEDIAIHGSLMASEGSIEVENFGAGSPRGNIRLLGGIIQKNYGGFGEYDPDTGTHLSGFGRQLTYDQRLAENVAPPYFPSTNAATIESVILLQYGQREQVY